MITIFANSFGTLNYIRIFALVIFEILIIGDLCYEKYKYKKELGLAATHVIRPKMNCALQV